MFMLSFTLLCTILLFIRLVSSTEDVKEQQIIESKRESGFIEPREISELEDVFVRGSKEYVFVNFHVNHVNALEMCKIVYKGRLALVETVGLAGFLAEALSETNLLMDSVWVGGTLINNTWCWYEEGVPVKHVDEKIMKLFVNYSEMVNATDRNCLAIAREDHDAPHFPTLSCNALRPYVCERQVSDSNNGSTHPNWITLGKRRYKLFQERVSWEEALSRCFSNDKKTHLAVLENLYDSQALGRYMLIGRPSLENAWIGAWYHNNNYVFMEENILLSNITDIQGYPPWRNGTIRKRNGCILLDRHLSNITLFIEARCDRKRPYICYTREEGNKNDTNEDIFIDEFGYRIYYNRVEWDMARDKCEHYKNRYHAKLVEIREKRIVSHMLYIMGENRTAIQHLWLGGVFDSALNYWVWDSDKLPVDLGTLNWLKNSTYIVNVEKFNTCLNMDRENAIKAMHYGTVCDFEQYFVCMFPKSKLEQLQKDEAVPRKTRKRKIIRYG